MCVPVQAGDICDEARGGRELSGAEEGGCPLGPPPASVGWNPHGGGHQDRGAPLAGIGVGGLWGVRAGSGRLGKAVRESPRIFLIKTSPCYCQISPKPGTVGVTLTSPLWKGGGRAGTGTEQGSKAGPTCPASAGGQAARTRVLQLTEDTVEQDAVQICETGKG